jgi:hypothetical protein
MIDGYKNFSEKDLSTTQNNNSYYKEFPLFAEDSQVINTYLK